MRGETVSPVDFNLIITTSLSPIDSLEVTARSLSQRLGIPYVERRNRSLREVTGSNAGAIVVESSGISLRLGGSVFRFHPNMAKLRVSQLIKGGRDRLVEVMELSPGDRVLDCTCGLAADAIVASFVVTQSGLVHALEVSPVLYEIVSQGLSTYADPFKELVDAMRRVQVFNVSYSDYLRRASDNEYDVVYFDPMFEQTYESSKGLEIVRILGKPDTPSCDDIAEAVRVAKRLVVMKDRTKGTRLYELGFDVVSAGDKIDYGVIRV